MKKINIVLIVVLAIAVAAVFARGYYVYQELSFPRTQTAVASPTAGWNTYDNFGIKFQYPNNWGFPQESMYDGWSQTNFYIDPNGEPFTVSIQPDFTDQSGKIETFEQMMNTFVANDKYIGPVKDIMVDGIAGKELYFNSAVTGRLYTLEGYFPTGSQSYVSFSVDISSMTQDIFDKIITTFKIDNGSQVKTDNTTGMLIYKNYGMEFEYPTKFNTNYASLNIQVSVQKTDTSKMDSNGCYPVTNGSGRLSPTTLVTINNTKFCATTSSDVGAGQAYTSYNYATFNHGNTYLINYIVHTPNACGGYENSPDVNAPGNEKYKECMDFEQNNYGSIVIKPIQASLATFKFIN